jgi:hypothetical protein
MYMISQAMYIRPLCPSSGQSEIAPPATRSATRQFALVDDNNPSQTEAFLIHEELHSLGLGENPPSPKEINARVLAMCRP